MSLYLCLCLFFAVSLRLSLSLSLSFCLSVSVCLSLSLPVCLSVSVSLSLSVCLSVFCFGADFVFSIDLQNPIPPLHPRPRQKLYESYARTTEIICTSCTTPPTVHYCVQKSPKVPRKTLLCFALKVQPVKSTWSPDRV